VTSFLASSAIYVGLAIAIITLGSAAKKVVRQAAVEVKFVETVRVLRGSRSGTSAVS